MDDLNRLKKQVEQAKEAARQLDSEVKVLEEVFNGTIEKLSGEEKQKVIELQVMANRAIQEARKGGDYNKIISVMKTKFK